MEESWHSSFGMPMLLDAMIITLANDFIVLLISNFVRRAVQEAPGGAEHLRSCMQELPYFGMNWLRLYCNTDLASCLQEGEGEAG